MKETIEYFEKILSETPQKLMQFSDAAFRLQPTPDKWSRKQILGHLIDSAANNHQRFVRIQYEHSPLIRYDQNAWNEVGNYQWLDKLVIIGLWESYNRLLLHIIKNIPEQNLICLAYSNEIEPHTLRWYIEDYLTHMQHHLDQIFNYE